jgi:hypothetical protein
MPDFTTYGTGYEFDSGGPYPTWAPTGSALPNKFVLPFREPVYNQGQANVAPLHAVASLKKQDEFDEHRAYYTFNTEIFYQSVKAVDGITNPGSSLDACIQLLTSYGYLADAETYKLDNPLPFPIAASYKLIDLSEIQDALYSRRPVLLGIEMDDGFRGTFSSVLPEPLGAATDAHAFVVYGWDDTRECESSTGALYIKNSWGKSWGDSGFAWLPYTYLTSYTFDAWCVDDSTDVIP